jgi:hypothetical protein
VNQATSGLGYKFSFQIYQLPTAGNDKATRVPSENCQKVSRQRRFFYFFFAGIIPQQILPDDTQKKCLGGSIFVSNQDSPELPWEKPFAKTGMAVPMRRAHGGF